MRVPWGRGSALTFPWQCALAKSIATFVTLWDGSSLEKDSKLAVCPRGQGRWSPGVH